MNIFKTNCIILAIVVIALSGIAFHVFADTEGNLPHAPVVLQQQNIFGDIVSVTQSTITIDPTDGPAGINPSQTNTTIPLDPSVSVSGNENGVSIQTVTDLTAGQMVQVFEDGNGNAVRIAVLPKPIAPVPSGGN